MNGSGCIDQGKGDYYCPNDEFIEDPEVIYKDKYKIDYNYSNYILHSHNESVLSKETSITNFKRH
jgi:hypothetical protein